MSTVKTKSAVSIDHVRDLLNQGLAYQALQYIEHSGQKTQVMENAKAVCLLRNGKTEQAVSLLKDIVFQGKICVPPETPLLYQINFALAMLVVNNKDFALLLLAKPEVRNHPQAAKLIDAVNKWRKSLTLLEKFCYHIGIYSRKPVKIDFPAGEV
ncbi:MAG: hypothetical protein WCZ89_00460 [Phycisphaerae bacterium]